MDTHQEADEASPRVETLQPGAAVRVIETDGQWAKVARDGAFLGYVKMSGLAAIY
jgi:hypothetical protein